MKKSTWTWDTVFFYIGIFAIIAAFVVAAIMRSRDIALTGHLQPCLLYTFLKIPCPGCGGTRAVQYLLQGRIRDSFLAHPLVLYAGVGYLYFMVVYAVETFYRKRTFYLYCLPFKKVVLIGAGMVLVVQWIAKLIFW